MSPQEFTLQPPRKDGSVLHSQVLTGSGSALQRGQQGSEALLSQQGSTLPQCQEPIPVPDPQGPALIRQAHHLWARLV